MTAARGRGKSAALGLALSTAVGFGYDHFHNLQSIDERIVRNTVYLYSVSIFIYLCARALEFMFDLH
jgi:hypothetical protein